jgi:hypothetical protein
MKQIKDGKLKTGRPKREDRKPIGYALPFPPRYLTCEETSQYLRVPLSQLIKWRQAGTGPTYIKARRSTILYSVADLDSWLSARRRTRINDNPTGDNAPAAA